MLPDTDLAGAEKFVARVRAEAQRVQADGLDAVALSLGAATAAPDEPLGHAIERADVAMYDDKNRRATHRLRSEGDPVP